MGPDSLAHSVARCAIRAGAAILLKRTGFLEWVVTGGGKGWAVKSLQFCGVYRLEDAMQSELAAAGYWKGWYLVWRSTKPDSEREAVVGDSVRVMWLHLVASSSRAGILVEYCWKLYIAQSLIQIAQFCIRLRLGVKWMGLQTGVVLSNGWRVGHSIFSACF